MVYGNNQSIAFDSDHGIRMGCSVAVDLVWLQVSVDINVAFKPQIRRSL